MQTSACNPYSTEEVEARFQELRAQRSRAELLFYGHAVDAEADDVDDDALSAYDDDLGDDQ